MDPRALAEAQHSIELGQALPFTRIPPMSRGELVAFAAIVTALTTNDPLRRSGIALIQCVLILTALTGMIVFTTRRLRINRTMPRMSKAPREIKRAYMKFAALYFCVFLAGFLGSILLPLPWAWAAIPTTFVGMVACGWFYEKWYYEGVRALEERLT